MFSKPQALIVWIVVPVAAFAAGWVAKSSSKPLPPSPGGERHSNPAGGVDRHRPALTATGQNPSGAKLTAAGNGSAASPWKSGEVGTRPAMSSAQIEAVGRRIRGELDPIKRRIAFARLLEGLTLENAAEIRAQIAHLPGSSSEFRDFHYAWGAIAGAEAVMHGAETREPDMHAALAGWAGSDPSAALAWFESLDAKGKGYENQAYLARGMIDGLANVDIGAATDLVFSLAAAGNEQAQGLMGLVRSKLLQSTDPASAAQWAADLPQGALRTASMDHMARAFLHSDQAAAAAWAENFAGDPAGPRVVRAVAEEWVRRDPPASIEWLASLPEMDGKNAAMGAAYGQWAKNDVTAASEYLVELQPSGARDAAISSFTRQLSVTNPEDAIIWAAEINDLGTRQGALVHIGRAMLGSDPEGARLWLSTSGLSAEQQQQVFSK